MIAHRIPEHVAAHEIATMRMLGWDDADARIEEVKSADPGNVLVATARCEHVCEVFVGFGERGVRAEDVGRRVAKEAQAWLDAGVPVGEHSPIRGSCRWRSRRRVPSRRAVDARRRSRPCACSSIARSR